MELEGLIERIAEKDVKALEDFYIHYGCVLYTTASKVVYNQLDVEEIINDVLGKIWEIAKKLIHLKNPIGYIITMTHNLAIDYYRKNLKHTKQITNYPINSITSEPKQWLLNDCLEQLEEKQRTILILKAFMTILMMKSLN